MEILRKEPNDFLALEKRNCMLAYPQHVYIYSFMTFILYNNHEETYSLQKRVTNNGTFKIILFFVQKIIIKIKPQTDEK